MNKKGFSLVELMGVIVILLIITLLATNGYRLVSQKVKENSYKNKVSYLETKAVEYANQTGKLEMNVDQLVKEGLITADNEEGKVISPLDGNIMNCHLIYITEENENLYGNYTEQEECNIENLSTENRFLKINVYKTHDNVTLGEKVEGNAWTKENVILVAEFLDQNINKDSIEKLIWRSNAVEEERTIEKDFESKNKYLVTAEQIVNSIYSVEIKLSDGTTYQAQTYVKIDKQRPIVYDSEIRIEKENEYTANDKEVYVEASDGNGSGIYGYYIGEDNRCTDVIYEVSESTHYSVKKPMGTYYVCVKDKAGNLSEDISTKKVIVQYIDSEPPTIKVKNDPLNLGTEDYEFKDNLEVTWGESGEGSISCDPAISKKTGTYEVKCIVIGNNGLKKEISFEARHSYKAKETNCGRKCGAWIPDPQEKCCSGQCGGSVCCSGETPCGMTDGYKCDWWHYGCDYVCDRGGRLEGDTCYFD